MLDNISSGKRLPEKSLLVLGTLDLSDRVSSQDWMLMDMDCRRHPGDTARVPRVGVDGPKQPAASRSRQEAPNRESVCAGLHVPGRA